MTEFKRWHDEKWMNHWIIKMQRTFNDNEIKMPLMNRYNEKWIMIMNILMTKMKWKNKWNVKIMNDNYDKNENE